jgi:hypothetical protein
MIVICSQQALNPAGVARVCRENPSEEVYALPWVTNSSELDENFRANRTSPNRRLPCVPNKEHAEGESMNFYDRLEDDAFGTMADALAHGALVINEIMKPSCESAFYGRVLSPGWVPNSVAIMNSTTADRLIPCEPLSARLYAMTTVPVMAKCTSDFKESTGCSVEVIPVLLATDFISRIGAFMQFYKLFSGKDCVFSAPVEDFSGHLPLRWRYNRAYKV